MRFYLGTHIPRWLWEPPTDYPLFVSHRQLRRYKRPREAMGSWALDSGGFTELRQHGKWTIGEGEYVDAVGRYMDTIGRMDWAASQDYMCEPFMLSCTGLTVREHQQRTIVNYLELKRQAPGIPFVPILQGWEIGEYQSHVRQYAEAGVDLRSLPLVGVGSVCRRTGNDAVGEILTTISGMGIRVHAFGLKMPVVRTHGHVVTSTDSLAWSYYARRKGFRLCPDDYEHSGWGNGCQNCKGWAAVWADNSLAP